MPSKLIVTGCARSGTTLLHSLMGCFKGVKVYRYAETLPARFNEKFAERYSGNADAPSTAGKKFVVIKRPQFHPEDERYFTIGELLAQGYRVINIFRDARDVLVSRHPNNPDIYWVEPERWLAAADEALRHMQSPDVLNLSYERLVLTPDECMAAMGYFLDTKYSKSYADFFQGEDARAYLDKAVMQGAGPIHTGSIGNWRGLEHQVRIERIMQTHGPAIRERLLRLGYEA